MESTFFASTVFIGVVLCGISLVIGALLGRTFGRNELSNNISQLNAEKLVLEEKLSSQKANFESQLKIVQDAKVSLTQEFENLANRIFEDKQTKFSEQSKDRKSVV